MKKHIHIIHKVSKYVYVIGLIVMFIAFFASNKGVPVKADTSELIVVVTGSTVNVEVPSDIDLGIYTGGSSVINVSKVFSGTEETFYIDDQKGSDDGYYTTIEMSDFIGQTYSGVISASNATISISSGAMQTYAGVDNNDVVINTYSNQMLDSALTFIERKQGNNFLRIGKYYPDPNNITINFQVPAYQSIDEYHAEVTITLYDVPNP